MWIDREISAQLRTAAASRPAVVLTGARQTGKTSLLRRLFPKHHFVSLDLPSEAELADKDPQSFFERHPPPLIIDEVQYAPRVFRYIKSMVDANRRAYGRFLLSGSQRFSLMQEVSDSLAGRTAIFDLGPLSAHEISTSLRGFSIESLVLRGGYPELYQNPDLDAFSFYRSYMATYLERDVRTLLHVTSLRDFERMIRACALRTGQLLNKAELARDVGISPSTANQWLSALEASGQVTLVEPWFSNKTRSLVKSPKLYLSDPGLLSAMLNIQTLEDLMRSPMIGAIWETFVFAELRKRETARHEDWSINFWHDRVREVDFVIDRGGRFDLYDAKWNSSPSPRDAAAIQFAAKQFGAKNVLRQALICRTPHSYPLTAGIRALPVSDL